MPILLFINPSTLPPVHPSICPSSQLFSSFKRRSLSQLSRLNYLSRDIYEELGEGLDHFHFSEHNRRTFQSSTVTCDHLSNDVTHGLARTTQCCQTYLEYIFFVSMTLNTFSEGEILEVSDSRYSTALVLGTDKDSERS